MPTFNIWEGRTSKIIAMNPIFWKTSAVRNNPVLYHERMHALLHRTYSADAFVNKNSAIQEALADFAAAHIEGTPDIGLDVFDKGAPLRNIESRFTQMMGKRENYNSLLDASATSYHDNSMFMSNVLWKMRESIGPNKMSTILKKLVDDMNGFRESFETLEKSSGVLRVGDQRQRFIYDFEYFLSVIQRAGTELGDVRITEVASSVARELGLSDNRVSQIARSLSRNGKTFAYDGKGQLVNGIKVAAYGAAGLAVEGYFIYNNVVSSDDKKKNHGR